MGCHSAPSDLGLILPLCDAGTRPGDKCTCGGSYPTAAGALRKAPRGPPLRATGTARQLEGGRPCCRRNLLPSRCRDCQSMGVSRLLLNYSLAKGVEVAKTQPFPW